jgi:ribosome recycling factor
MKYINYTAFFEHFNYKLWTKAIKDLKYIKVRHERYYLVSEVMNNLKKAYSDDLNKFDLQLQKKTNEIAKKLDQIGVDIDIFDNTKK